MATDSSQTLTPVVELKQISSDVYSAAPLQSGATGDDEAGPSVILIFGWMDAELSHTKKYIDSYAKLYPHASQILVRSRRAFFWKGRKAKESSLLPAIDLLKKEGLLGPGLAPSLLVHAFSNGGGFQLVELSRMLESTFPIPRSSSATAIVYDSLPGRLELISTVAAFTQPIKSSVGKLTMSILLTVAYFVLGTIAFVMRKRLSLDQLRLGLNRARVLPWMDANTPRLYLYSDTDELVQETAVAEHIAQAKELGLNVRAEYFKGSAHVSHARYNSERYWAAVRSVWAEAAVKK